MTAIRALHQLRVHIRQLAAAAACDCLHDLTTLKKKRYNEGEAAAMLDNTARDLAHPALRLCDVIERELESEPKSERAGEV